MSKFKRGNINIDDDNKILFKDSYGNEHRLYWDDSEECFIFERSDLDQYGNPKKSILRAGGYLNATNAVVMTSSPSGNLYDYIVPTLWLNVTNGEVHILKEDENGNRFWDQLVTSGSGVVDQRITLNDGSIEPTQINDYQMWVIIQNN